MTYSLRREHWHTSWRWVARDNKGHLATKEITDQLKKEKFGRRMWRLTLGINYVVTHKYQSETLIKYYRHEPTDAEIDEAKKEIIKQLEERIKYRRSAWWFDDHPNIGIERMKADRSLVGRDFSEHADHLVFRVSEDDVRRMARKTMARRAILSGKWHRQATLDRWVDEFSREEWGEIMVMRRKF